MVEVPPTLSSDAQEVWSAAYQLGTATGPGPSPSPATSSSSSSIPAGRPLCASIEASTPFGARHIAYVLFCQHPLGARVAWGTGCTDVAVLKSDITRCAALPKEAAKASGLFDNADELLATAARRTVEKTKDPSLEDVSTEPSATIELDDLFLALFDPNFRLLPLFHKSGLRLDDVEAALPRALRAVQGVYRSHCQGADGGPSPGLAADGTPASSLSSPPSSFSPKQPAPACLESSSGANHEPPATLNQAMKTAAARLRDLNGGAGGDSEEGPAPIRPSAVPSPEEIDAEMRELAPRAARRAAQRRPVLASCAIDLVDRAREGKLDPVIGRDPEISRVLQILARRTKNNVALVGAPGVGKTAVAEAVAQRIADGRVPPQLKSCEELWSLDIGALLAGTGLRGDFEERLRDLLAEVRASQGAALLFIDELHLVLGAGRSENNNVDAANLMKPMLARGELRCIGATTTEEYENLIFKKDAAFERRFQVVPLKEPDAAASVAMLQGLLPLYEKHHHITIPLSVAEIAVHASIQYIPKRSLPDKAIDVLDEACCYATEEGAKQVTQHHIDVVAARWHGTEQKEPTEAGVKSTTNATTKATTTTTKTAKETEMRDAAGVSNWLHSLAFPWLSRRSRL